LGFTQEEIEMFPATKLPLFSEAALCWENENQWTEYLRIIIKIREKFIDLENNYSTETIIFLVNSNDNIITFARKFKDRPMFFFMGNMHPDRELYFNVKLPNGAKLFTDSLTNEYFNVVNDELIMNLKPFQAMCGELKF
jgi:hypothetical protein